MPWNRLSGIKSLGSDAKAVEALKRIPREQAIEALRQALQDEHPYVRQAAQEVLTLSYRIRQ